MNAQAKVRYVNDEWRERDDIPYIGTKETRHANTSEYDVVIRDARDLQDSLDLNHQGFMLADFTANIDFRDESAVRRSQQTVIAPFLCEFTGAKAAFVGSYILRTEDQSSYLNAYARFVHTDYRIRNDSEVEQRVLDQMGYEANISDFDYAWFNVWLPFDHEVKQNALALIDASTFNPDERLDYRFSDSTNAIASVPTYNEDHQFYYFSNMLPGEALVFKQLDSRIDKAGMCPHTAFYDTTVGEAPGRRSIEFRGLCLFDRSSSDPNVPSVPF